MAGGIRERSLGEAGSFLRSYLVLHVRDSGMDETEQKADEKTGGMQPAADGVGPLLQRDYWAVIRESRLSCSEVASLVRRRFEDFPPAATTAFRRRQGGERPLEVGDEMEVAIHMAGTTGVRVLHVNSNSLTVGTKKGHPEAGRITFGAYPNEQNDVVFHIRSRARSGSATDYAGFLTAGDPMQTNTWTDFIDHVAHSAGDGVLGAIHVSTKQVTDEGDEAKDGPTFVARGDVE